GPGAVAPDADVRGHRLLPPVPPRASQPGQARRICPRTSSCAVEEARAGTPRVRLSAGPGAHLAGGGHGRVSRPGPRLDPSHALHGTVRAARVSGLPTPVDRVDLPGPARPALDRP